MKQISCSLRQRSTDSGGAVVLMPSASSTSALPQREVATREPCFATGRPAPATTKAAAVETLKVFAALDPVPAVSINRAWRDRNGSARFRIASAIPASSSQVSPLAARLVSAAAICASVAIGLSRQSRKLAASARLRFSPPIKRTVTSRSSKFPASLLHPCLLLRGGLILFAIESAFAIARAL